jgi:cell division protein FtsI (penicillin-binding protein 3)
VTDPRRRLLGLLAALLVVLTVVIGRLAVVQGPAAGHYAKLGRSQRLRTVVLPAERGAIVDRNGNDLAVSTRRRTVWANPQSVRDPVAEARALAPLLGQTEAQLRDRLTAEGGFQYLARKVDDTVADRVAALNLAGVSLLEEPKRVDPAAPLGSSLLGQVGLDDQGLSGLELQYQKDLAGRAGQLVVEKDPGGNEIASGVRQLTASQRGRQLVLTIDRSLQYEAERVLTDQVAASHAKGGIAVVMDPRSGEILAMANVLAGTAGGPPTVAGDNLALTRVYEPGSVNKLITVSAALEEGVVAPNDAFVVPDHTVVAGSTFHDAEPHATESMPIGRIVSDSSNVGTIMIARNVGAPRIDRYLRSFGLGSPTGLRFPGETPGLLTPLAKWSGTSLATVPIGQGVAVTAVQMLAAYNTIADDGVYVAPTLVHQVVDANGKVHGSKPPARRRVVSSQTAKAMTTMLQGVVRDGTGKAAAVAGYSVAGKTGTAQKPRTDGPGYADGAYVATFAGFAPANDPKLSAIVVLDEPTPIFGGLVSAPAFSQLAGFTLRLLTVPPDAPGSPGPASLPASAPAPPSTATTATTSPATKSSSAKGRSTLGATPTSRP